MHGQHFDPPISPGFIGPRTRLCGSRSRAQGALRQLPTASRDLLTTRGDGATLELSSPAATRSPLHIGRCGAYESAAPGHDSSSSLDSLPGRPSARRRVRGSSDRIRIALWPKVTAYIRLGAQPHCEGHTPQSRKRQAATAIRLPAVDASEPHSVLPIQSRTSTRNRHRRSTWAGVSWPNDDDHDGHGDDDICRAFLSTQTDGAMRAPMILSAHSSACSHARPHVSCLSRN
jgi:hypothetical protein